MGDPRGAIALVLTMGVAGCGTTTHYPPATTNPTAAVRTSTPGFCTNAGDDLVSAIDAAFVGGEHLEHAQAITSPEGDVYIGGNIFNGAGQKESSQDTWVLTDGRLYALTSDARHRTRLPDGRELPVHDFAWTDYNNAVSKCVGDLERRINTGR